MAGPGSSGRCLGAGWPSATWTATAGPTSSSTALDAPAALLQNRRGGDHFLNSNSSIETAGRPWVPGCASRQAAGARSALVAAGGSYLASSQPRLCFGLGEVRTRRPDRGGLAVGSVGSLAATRDLRLVVRCAIEQGTGRLKSMTIIPGQRSPITSRIPIHVEPA